MTTFDDHSVKLRPSSTPTDSAEPPGDGGHTSPAAESTWTGPARFGVTGVVAASSLLLTLSLTGSSAADPPAEPLAAEQEPVASPAPEDIDVIDRAIAAARADRSANRTRVGPAVVAPKVIGKRYATVDLNVRTKPDEDAKVVAVLDEGDKVKITDVKQEGWRQVLYDGKARWVKSAYLSKVKPPEGPSDAPCSAGSGGSEVESGLSGNAIAAHRAVCNEFPSVTTYGGTRGGSGNHGTGHAVDIMVSSDTGDAIAAYLRAHWAALGVTEVIWRQRIWTTQRASEGWRWMSDRGSATDNHYDHVHVSVS